MSIIKTIVVLLWNAKETQFQIFNLKQIAKMAMGNLAKPVTVMIFLEEHLSL